MVNFGHVQVIREKPEVREREKVVEARKQKHNKGDEHEEPQISTDNYRQGSVCWGLQRFAWVPYRFSTGFLCP